jgi:hypothetical protein
MTNTDPIPAPIPLPAPPDYVTSVVALVLRHALTALGGWLVSSGFFTQAESSSIVNWLLGLAAIVVALVWSAYEKKAKLDHIKLLTARLQ